MKQTLLIVLSVLYLSACGGSSESGSTDPLAIANSQNNNQTESTVDPQNSTNVASVTNLGEAEPTPLPPSVVDSVSISSPIPVQIIPGLTEAVEVVPATSRVSGNITLLNDSLPTGDVSVQIRGTDISGLRQSNGEFTLEIPESDTDRPIVLDISGAAIVNKSVPAIIPANANVAWIDTTVTASAPPITFSLASGGDLQNEGSPTRTTVTVPANAFAYDDGTVATGEAQVSITEINIEDLEGEGAWAPNLIGMAEGATEPSAISTYGMSDFQFSQNGRDLQLRPGMEATITMDLLSPTVWQDGDAAPINATNGSTIPLWHYDTNEMIWKEEGESTVLTDAESQSGLKASGQVSHFSSWNLDWVTPSMTAEINIKVVDQNGNLLNNMSVESFSTRVGIPPEEGPGWHNTASWSNSVSTMTPSNNTIEVRGNTENRQNLINNHRLISGWTIMDVAVSNIVITGSENRLVRGPLEKQKIFIINSDDNVVDFEVVVPIGPIDVEANVEVELVNEQGVLIEGIDVISYRATAISQGSEWSNVKTLTPDSTAITVQGNTQAAIDASLTITTEIAIDNLVIQNDQNIADIPSPQTRVFKTFENNNTVTFQVVILPE